MKPYFAIFILILDPGIAFSQTCCSGGVPLAGNIGGVYPSDQGVLSAAVNLDGNYLRKLKDGNDELNDETRERVTYSTLLRFVYTVNDRVALEALFSHVIQQRWIKAQGSRELTRTAGFGDMVLMGYYNYAKPGRSIDLVAGAGIKVPAGASDLSNSDGITLNADLQPGSGAWDVILHHRITGKPAFRPSAGYSLLFTYRLTGENDDYLGSQIYEFGDELQLLLALWDQTLIFGELFSAGLNLRFRHAAMDQNNHEDLPNTGGVWLFVMPALSWMISPSISISTTFELPVYSYVEGTQLTPSFRFNAGILWNIPIRKSKNISP